MSRRCSVSLVCVLLLGWAARTAAAQQNGAATPAATLPRVTRAQALVTAQTYLLHVWTPTARNTLHGLDPDGVRVDTPDAGFRPAGNGTRPGWWIAGEKNVGMPYQWGGFCTPAEFDAGLRAGRAAGDVYTAAKHAALDDAVSRHAVGIDCSGLISRCWRLPRAYSTRELAALCQPLASVEELRAGDIMNLHNAHVLMFVEFTNKERTRLAAYEAGSPPTWKVLLNEMPVKFLTDQGYAPYRYRGIIDGSGCRSCPDRAAICPYPCRYFASFSRSSARARKSTLFTAGTVRSSTRAISS